MSDKKVKDTVRTKIFAVVSVVMGVIASIIITLNAYIDLVFDCRRSLIVSLILASLYVFLGITFRKVCRRSKERLSVQVISLIASILLIPSTVPVLTAMYALTFMPAVYNDYRNFSRSEQVFIREEDIPAGASDIMFLKAEDGHVNAVSFRLDEDSSGIYENNVFQFTSNGYGYGEPVSEYSSDVENRLKGKYKSLLDGDDISDYVVLDYNLGNEWYDEYFVNRETGRYIYMVTHN